MRNKFFTLIELMIVITIIVILAALLLPSLGKARGKSHEIKCVGNLKQLGVGVHLYYGDVHFYPAYWTGGQNFSYPLHDLRFWLPDANGNQHGVILPASSTVSNKYSQFACPSVAQHATARTNTIGINDCFGGANNWKTDTSIMARYYNLRNWKKPSKLAYLGDSTKAAMISFLDYRHRNALSANIWYIDGHVGPVKRYPFDPEYKNIPEAESLYREFWGFE